MYAKSCNAVTTASNPGKWQDQHQRHFEQNKQLYKATVMGIKTVGWRTGCFFSLSRCFGGFQRQELTCKLQLDPCCVSDVRSVIVDVEGVWPSWPTEAPRFDVSAQPPAGIRRPELTGAFGAHSETWSGLYILYISLCRPGFMSILALLYSSSVLYI